MNTTGASASVDLAAVSVDELDDPTAVGAGIELIEQDAVQLQAMPLRARRVIVRLADSSVVHYSSNLRVRTRTSARPGWLAWVTFGPRARGTVNGLPVRPGRVLAAEPGAEVGFVAEAGWQSITFLLSARLLAAQLAARQREFRLPRGVELLQVAPQHGRRLYAWGKRLTVLAARQPARFEPLRKERVAAQAELLETLLDTVGLAGDLDASRDDRTRQAQGLIVKRAEDHALAQAGEHLHVGDLCRAAGVSERTLQYAFKEILGLTPMAYLVRLRLHRVRRALLAARPGSTTVAAEALDCGFWHFGEFSRAYRECFGELPSATLRRRPVAPDANR